MKPKAAIAMALMMAAMSETGMGGKRPRVEHEPLPKGTTDRNKNLKEFHINGKTVWAINEKNAIKKAKKQ